MSTPAEAVANALRIAEDIGDLCDDDDDRIPSWAKNKNAEYFESCAEKANSIAETIHRTDYVTVNQLQALENTRNGLLRWVRG